MITDDIWVFAKLGTVSLTMVAATTFSGVNAISIPLIGVPLTAVTMAAAGAMCAFAWPRAEASRGRLFGVTLASTFVGAACVTVIPHLFNVEWPKELQAPLAFLFGMLAPWVVPAIRPLIPSFVQGLASLILRIVGTKAGGTSGTETNPTGTEASRPRVRGKESESETGE